MSIRDLQNHCRLLAERLSESVHIVDHDPSLAFYRLQEHVGKSLPALNSRKYSIVEVNAALQGACFDLDNIICAVQSIEDASDRFSNIKKLLCSCEEYGKQLNLSNVLQRKDSVTRTRSGGSGKKSAEF